MPFYGDPFKMIGQSGFIEIFRRDIAGFAKGKILVNAQCTTGGGVAVPIPGFYVDVQICGVTLTTEEVLFYGATGMQLTAGTVAPTRPDNLDLSAPPVHTTWTDEDGFDQILVRARTLVSGTEEPTAANGTAIVNVSGRLWR